MNDKKASFSSDVFSSSMHRLFVLLAAVGAALAEMSTLKVSSSCPVPHHTTLAV